MRSMQQGYYGSGSTPWYDFSVSSDYALSGGSSSYQNTDVATPIDTVLSAPTAGTITYLGYPVWGGQVTYKEDHPTDPNNPYVFLIHMDSLNPNLKVGQHISAGTFLGFSGGQVPGQFTSLPALPAGYTHHDTSSEHSTGPHTDMGVTNSPSGSLDNNQAASNKLVSLAKKPPPGTNPITALCASLPPSLAFVLCGVVPPVQSGVNDVVASGAGPAGCAPWDVGCILSQAAPYALRVFLFIAGAVLIVVGLRILFPAVSGPDEGTVNKLVGAIHGPDSTSTPAPAQPAQPSKSEKRLKKVETVAKVAAFL